MRWSEEVELLREEMRRVLVFLTWRADWWTECGFSMAAACTDRPAPYIEGLLSYSVRQAGIQRALAKRFADLWRVVPGVTEEVAEGVAASPEGDD